MHTKPAFVLTLRGRILGTLATSTIVAAACGGSTSGPASSSSGGSSSGGSSSGSSGASGSSSSSGSSGEPTCAHGQKERTCYGPGWVPTRGEMAPDPDAAPPPPPTRDANGCVVVEEAFNGCCNPAVSGPVFEDGECCYEFCAGACCGRPVLVDGAARVAPLRIRDDWSSGAAQDEASTHIDARTRDALRDAWTRDALLEHASIASFATFTLELLALGAPSDLVRAAQAAAADEIEHARLTFAVASRYAEGSMGPGALDVSGIVPSSRLADVAAACVRDGCLNETIASAIAGAQASVAADPDLRAALERISEDEARHAELAWRFVQWALGAGGADVREAVVAAFEAPVARSVSVPDGIDAAVWRAHGRLLASEHASTVDAVVAQVIAPCRDRLLARPGDEDRSAPPARSPSPSVTSDRAAS
ncbi:MAG: ferritin-like domain-containing protein [Labilithrix sp.]|nr:ferritin-like domain-containing protein [Labilithrix sp.]